MASLIGPVSMPVVPAPPAASPMRMNPVRRSRILPVSGLRATAAITRLPRASATGLVIVRPPAPETRVPVLTKMIDTIGLRDRHRDADRVIGLVDLHDLVGRVDRYNERVSARRDVGDVDPLPV